MLSKNRTLRLVLLLTPVVALIAVALVLALGPGNGHRAEAGSSVNFALGIDFNGDGVNDCGTGVPSAVGDGAPDAATADVSNTTCNVPTAGATLAVGVYLMSTGGFTYQAATGQVNFTGITSTGAGSTVWTCHVFDAVFSGDGYEVAGSSIGTSAPCNVPETNVGLMNKFAFTCTASGTIRLANAAGETSFNEDIATEHLDSGTDALTVTCGSTTAPTDTPPAATNTPVGPTNTPAGPTNTAGPPTLTPTRTNTPLPTATRPPTATPSARLGDVNGDGSVTAADALWVLQAEAGIVSHVPLPENGDMNHDGHINAIDALFILWHVGGRISS